jgi:hypothetical protein
VTTRRHVRLVTDDARTAGADDRVMERGSDTSVPADPPDRRPAWRRRLADPQVRVALVTAACLLAEAVIAKNVLDVELGFMSQAAPMWVFITYLVSGLRDRASEIAFTIAIIAVTCGVLILHAI